MNTMRINGQVGMIEDPTTLHFSEWWNGEGIDFTFGDNEDKHISLHQTELESLFIATIASGYLDTKDLIKQAKKLRKTAGTTKNEA